ncbi:MAG: acetyl-CoA carboxylase biotin carboxylase subunit family protein [Myxococcota bacterium]
MDVVFLNPVFPSEMQDFARGLSQVGARVWGVGDRPAHALPDALRAHLTGYLHVPRILDEADVVKRVVSWLGGRRPDRVEACWEPLVIAAAHLREHYGVPGMSVDTVVAFRDKQRMKERVAAAGVRVPHSARVTTVDEAKKAAERVGYPLILKPIAGAGSADTYRVDEPGELEPTLQRMGHVTEASCEEFIDGEEFTYDTVCVDGTPGFENVAQYLPRPLIARTEEWISPIILTYRNLEHPRLAEGIALGRKVLSALSMGTGFTHMEWYKKESGEVVFGEIGCRPGGARLVDQMNLGSDTDLFVEWARAVVHGQVHAPAQKAYCTAIVFKRATGHGVIRRIDGLDAFLHKYGEHVVIDDVLRPGQPRRDWKQTLLSDGFLVVRHPQANIALDLAREAAATIHLHASPS